MSKTEKDHCAREGAVVILFATQLRTLRLRKPELLNKVMSIAVFAYVNGMLYLRTT